MGILRLRGVSEMKQCCYIEFFTGAKFGSRDWLAIYHTTVVIRYFMPYRRIHIMKGKSLLKSAHRNFFPTSMAELGDLFLSVPVSLLSLKELQLCLPPLPAQPARDILR